MSKPALNTGHYTLNNGVKMPKFGLGTWLSDTGLVQKAVEHAIDNGYRHIDCAHVYGNEHEVGAAIANKIAQGVVKREDLFITSKLWLTYLNPSKCEENLNITLKNLGTDYVDLYLIHWPVPMVFKDAKTNVPKDENDEIMPDYNTHYTATFQKLIEIKNSSKKLRAIGLSNFNEFQIKKIVDTCTEKPQMNQFECHPYLNQSELIKCCKGYDMAWTCYSPLGNPGRPPIFLKDQKVLMDDAIVKSIAEKMNKTVANILVKWSIQRGGVCIAKSTTPERIVANAQVFDFDLSDEDMAAIEGLNANLRYVDPHHFGKSPYYPFASNYSE